jgi:hypothetical protein
MKTIDFLCASLSRMKRSRFSISICQTTLAIINLIYTRRNRFDLERLNEKTWRLFMINSCRHISLSIDVQMFSLTSRRKRNQHGLGRSILAFSLINDGSSSFDNHKPWAYLMFAYRSEASCRVKKRRRRTKKRQDKPNDKINYVWFLYFNWPWQRVHSRMINVWSRMCSVE